MSRPPRLQKSFSYTSENEYAVEPPSLDSPGAAHGHRYRSSLKPSQGGRRRSSVFNTLWSFLRKAPSPEPEDKPDSVEDVEDIGLTPEAALESSLAQKQEEAWTQACFNAVAMVFVFITGCICLAVYYVLEPFLHPLMWAVLIGMVLHPFKYAGTSQIKEWLTYLDTSGIPLSLGLLLSPAFVFNWLTQYFEYCFMSSWKTIFGLVFLIVSLFLVYVLNLPLHAYRVGEELMVGFEVVNDYMEQTSFIQVCTLGIGFVILLVLTVRGSDYFAPVKILSISLWFLLMVNLGTRLLGSVSLPLIIGTFSVAALVGVFCSSFKKQSQLEDSELKDSWIESGVEPTDSVLEKGLTLNTALRTVLSLNFEDTDTPEGGEEGGKEEAQVEVKGKKSSFSFFPSKKKEKDTKKDDGVKVKRSALKKSKEKKKLEVDDEEEKEEEEEISEDKPKVSFASTETVTQISPVRSEISSEISSPEMDVTVEDCLDEEELVDGRARLFTLSEMSAKQRAQARAQSNRVFIVLFTACFVVYVWRHPLLVLLFTPFIVWSGLKYAFNWAITSNTRLITQMTNKWRNLKSELLARKSVLFPSPIPNILQIYLAIDKKILSIVRSSVGGLLSTFIIVSLIIATTAVTVLLLFEIQGEVMHYVTSALTVWNSTVADTQKINKWMGVEGNETTLTVLEKFANQNYAYGREWLTSQVRGLIADNTSSIEHHVVEIYDQLYGYFVMNNSSAFVTATNGVGVAKEAGQQNLTEDKVPWAELKELATNNLEIIVSVLKSLWAILSNNMTVAFSFLYTVLEVLFSGGSALINFVVFITALFYLLSYSDEHYLPMKWVTDFLLHLSPGSSPSGSGGSPDQEHYSAPIESAETFSRIIRSVFHASFRRAFFYGLYTWLIHTMFGLSVSILPSVLAGIAGAMPFVGAYWVALPAVLELWLLQGQLLTALAVMGLSLLPLFFVDTIINREIEGGHPYLTGLAIAGGIYFAGLEGALIGPILLCCLLFFIDFYSGLFNNA